MAEVPRLSTDTATQPLNSEANTHDPGRFGQEVDTLLRREGVPVDRFNANPASYPDAAGMPFPGSVTTQSFARYDVTLDRTNANTSGNDGSDAGGDKAQVRDSKARNMYATEDPTDSGAPEIVRIPNTNG